LLNLTHSQGARWITGAFRTSPTSGVLAAAGLMPMHYNLKKLYNRSILQNETFHYNHLSLSLLNIWNSKGSILHPDTLAFSTRRRRDIIKSLLDGELLQSLSETFMPLHESVKPGIRFVDKYLEHIKFNYPLKGQQNIAAHHDEIGILEDEPTVLHFVLGESAHSFERHIPVSNRTHNHGGYVFIQGGEKKKLKIQPAGQQVSQEDTACWSALLLIIKVFKVIKQSPNSYERINLYTSSIGAIERLCNTS
jgi:hypothetical protein